MATLHQLMLGLLITVVASSRALAICGDVDASTTITATDALVTLRVAIGVAGAIDCPCDDCVDAAVARAPQHCADVDGDALVTASDALAILFAATGQPASLSCSCDACSASALTTTTTLPACLSADALDGHIFYRKSRCLTSFLGCQQSIVTDRIRFDHLGGGAYEVRLAQSGALLHVGTLSCVTFTGSTFQEFGTWTFQGDASFSGAKSFCRYTGVKAPGLPLDPPPIRCGLPRAP